jgi:four helix bundle protein
MEKRYDLEDRLIDFSVDVSKLIDSFPSTIMATHVAKQLMRCSTSPFANYGEARAAESRKDFLHKLRICLKELRETQAWLRFVERMNYGTTQVSAVRQECNELVSVFVVSVRTTQSKCRMSNSE